MLRKFLHKLTKNIVFAENNPIYKEVLYPGRYRFSFQLSELRKCLFPMNHNNIQR